MTTKIKLRHRILSARPGLKLGDIKQCIYAVSLSADPAAMQNVLAGFAWTIERIPNCAVLIGDSLYRIEHSPDKSAGIDAGYPVERGKAFVSEFCRHVPDSIRIIRTKDIQTDARYTEAFARIMADYALVREFQASIDQAADDYIARQVMRGRLTDDAAPQARELSVQYLLEEIAIYDVLACDGWLVDAYFGSEIAPLAGIIAGEIPKCGTMLHMRSNISLRRR
jgi:hypothetical protein